MQLIRVPVTVERRFDGGLWRWKASVWIGHELHLEIGFTRAGTLRRLRKSIKFAMSSGAQPETVVLELD